MSNESRKMTPQLLSDYCFLHYSYKYDWLRPTLAKIIELYKKIYGKDPPVSDPSSSDSEGSESEDEEPEPEKDGVGEAGEGKGGEEAGGS